MFMQPCLTLALRKHRSDFVKPQDNNQSNQLYYDFEHDKALIEASFASQYGIRLRQEPDITLAEFISLLSGLAGETPLGRVVAVRMEKDPDIIKKFGDWERRVRVEWVRFKAQHFGQKPHEVRDTSSNKTAQEVFKELFGKK